MFYRASTGLNAVKQISVRQHNLLRTENMLHQHIEINVKPGSKIFLGLPVNDQLNLTKIEFPINVPISFESN